MKESGIEKEALVLTAIGSLLAGVGSIIYLLTALSALATIQPAWGQSSAAVRLEAGIAKEDVDGDLKGAMSVYQAIAEDAAAPRDVRSKALLKLGGCYEKLGGQAKQVYEQLVRDFGDQPAAAEARSRLTSIARQEHPAAPSTMTLRKIEWTAVGRMDAPDTDGQRAVYRDSTGSLFFGDLGGHSKRLVWKAGSDDRFYWAPSRDFSIVWLRFPAKSGKPAMVAAVGIDGNGYRELIRDDDQGSLLRNSAFGSWSWDSHSFLFFTRPDSGGGRLMMVSAADGQRRELARIDAGEFEKAVFSPNGRYVAYEVHSPPQFEGGAARVFVLPVQGGEPHLVYESTPGRGFHDNATLVDWMADGRNLGISDARKGRTALYLLPVRDGAAAGDPVLVRYGEFGDGYITAGGALVYRALRPGGNDLVALGSLAPDGHVASWRRVEVRGDNRNRNPWPSFSPDSRQIAYVAQDQETSASALVLQEIATGKERVLYRSDSGDMNCQFANQHPRVFCAEDKPGHSDLISVVVESGEVERLGSTSGELAIMQTSPDDSFLYVNKFGPKDSLLMRWDLAARQDTGPIANFNDGYAQPSLDDRWLVRFAGKRLYARPLAGGDWKTLGSVGQQTAGRFATTPDGKWVLYPDKNPAGKLSLFRAPVEGGEPQRIGDLPAASSWFTLHISPDGHQLMAVTALENPDLWVLENFIPAARQ